MKIEEGNEFRFKVEKLITLPDGQYYILLAEFDQKYLLPAKYYTEYDIKIGDEIICKIDKVNCNGKVFLEPQHPIYSAGDIDTFVIKEEELREKHKTKEKYLIIKAENEKTKRAITANILSDISHSQNKRYLCEVVKTKKGEVILKVISKV